jgi:5'-methylthioadenosine phosphorylase
MYLTQMGAEEAALEGGNIAIIGGTGFERLPPDMFAEEITVETGIGEVAILSISNNYVEPYKLFFLSRHGQDHAIAPHEINFRANILALTKLDVKYIMATNAVGALRTTMQPGDLVLFDDFIDFTKGRHPSLFAGSRAHTDFSKPYSNILRNAVLKSADRVGVPIHSRCTYICTNGPRFESPAEVRMFAAWGADVVGMTGLPEAVFAREANIHYAAIGVVTNLAAGLSSQPVSHEEVASLMEMQAPVVRELLLETCAVIRRQQGS